MTTNLYFPTRNPIHRDSDRGSPQEARAYYPDVFSMLRDAVETTLTIHEACLQNCSCLSHFYTEAYRLISPYYTFPMQVTQHYFAFIFGVPQCISEPLAGSQRKVETLELRYPQRAECDEDTEEIARAMDIAIGADTSLWVEVEEVERAMAA